MGRRQRGHGGDVDRGGGVDDDLVVAVLERARAPSPASTDRRRRHAHRNRARRAGRRRPLRRSFSPPAPDRRDHSQRSDERLRPTARRRRPSPPRRGPGDRGRPPAPRWPRLASSAATLTVVVVLPTPPLRLRNSDDLGGHLVLFAVVGGLVGSFGRRARRRLALGDIAGHAGEETVRSRIRRERRTVPSPHKRKGMRQGTRGRNGGPVRPRESTMRRRPEAPSCKAASVRQGVQKTSAMATMRAASRSPLPARTYGISRPRPNARDGIRRFAPPV